MSMSRRAWTLSTLGHAAPSKHTTPRITYQPGLTIHQPSPCSPEMRLERPVMFMNTASQRCLRQTRSKGSSA